MSLNIKRFSVLNTTTGKMAVHGRQKQAQVVNILSHRTFNDETVERQTINGTPDTISSSEMLYGKSHMSSSYIKCVTTFNRKSSVDCVFIPYNIIRFTYIGGTTSASNSLLYGFAPSPTTPVADIVFNVLIAKNTSQTVGDYWDIQTPDSTAYPTLYIALVLVNSAWDKRTIVSGNVCDITTLNTPNYCIDPIKSDFDTTQSHFIISQCYNSKSGLATRITIAMEDWIFNETEQYDSTADRDYNDFIISISSPMISDIMTNDTDLS